MSRSYEESIQELLRMMKKESMSVDAIVLFLLPTLERMAIDLDALMASHYTDGSGYLRD